MNGGQSEIRTHGGRKPSTVFKTVAFNRSAIHPHRLCAHIIPTFLPKASLERRILPFLGRRAASGTGRQVSVGLTCSWGAYLCAQRRAGTAQKQKTATTTRAAPRSKRCKALAIGRF